MKTMAPRALGTRLTTIGLAEINHDAALLARKDRKYIVPREVVDRLLDEHSEDLRVLAIGAARTFRYESVYFDTPGLLTYLAAARSRPRRFKVRTRTYVDTGECMLEVKNLERTGMTVKSRMPYEPRNRARLTPDALSFLDGFEDIAPHSHDLRSTLTTRYRRTTLLELASGSRVTVDVDFECFTAHGERLRLPDLVLAETKTSGAPCATDRFFWANHCRPKRISKYCTGLAVLHPDLPANKWNRVLREHFGAMDGLPSRPATHTRLPAPADGYVSDIADGADPWSLGSRAMTGPIDAA